MDSVQHSQPQSQPQSHADPYAHLAPQHRPSAPPMPEDRSAWNLSGKKRSGDTIAPPGDSAKKPAPYPSR